MVKLPPAVNVAACRFTNTTTTHFTGLRLPPPSSLNGPRANLSNMLTAADFLKDVIPAALPGVLFFHGTLKQLSQQLDKLPARGQCVCLNDSLNFTVATTATGAQEPSFTLSLVCGIKSHPNWSAAQRNQVQRVTLAWARLLGPAMEKAGATVKGSLQGSTFFNLFDVNIDGCTVAYQVTLPDAWDYCIPQIPELPAGL